MSPKAMVFKKMFTTTKVPAFKIKVESVIGSAIEVHMDMDSFDVNYGNGSVLESSSITEGFENNCFNPLIEVLEKMAQEPRMKDFLKDSLKKIEISNTTDQDGMYGFASFEGHTLSFRAPATKNTNGRNAEEISALIFNTFNEAA